MNTGAAQVLSELDFNPGGGVIGGFYILDTTWTTYSK